MTEVNQNVSIPDMEMTVQMNSEELPEMMMSGLDMNTERPDMEMTSIS